MPTTALPARHVALAALLNVACPSLALDPIVTDGSTGAPSTGDPLTDGDGTATEPVTGGAETTTELMAETTADPVTASTAMIDDTTADTGPSGCIGDIVDNLACGGLTPYCVDGACVGCTQLDCSQVEVDKPICAEDLGTCVPCQQDTCKLCSEHEQCPESACNLETGECFPEDSVLYVDNSPASATPCSDVMPPPWGQSPEQPLCALYTALTRLVEGQPTTIKIKTGTNPQTIPSGILPGNFVAAITYYGPAVPSLTLPSTDPALTISEGNTVFMHRVGVTNKLVPMSDPLILCDGGATGARLWLDQQRIVGGHRAIRANNCRVHIRRSVLTDHKLDVIRIDGDLASLSVENSHITDNNGSFGRAILVSGAADVDILYSTLALIVNPVPQIECTDSWTGQLTIRNSALVSDGSLYSAACDPNVTTSFELPGADPNTLMDVFADTTDGVFAATPGGQLAGAAVWKTADPTIDGGGDPRPIVDGSPDYAGADRPAR